MGKRIKKNRMDYLEIGACFGIPRTIKKQINSIVKDITPLIIKLYYHDDLICPNCLRNVPNKNWFTKEGCIWCDGNYYRQKNVKNKKASQSSLTTREKI